MGNSVGKGAPSDHKSSILKYVTVEPIREHQHGQSVLAHSSVYLVGSDAVEANSTVNVINATAHAARVGDIISITSGALIDHEVKVLSVTANTITLAEDLTAAPAAADTFDILRHKYQLVGASGGSVGGFAPVSQFLTAQNMAVSFNSAAIDIRQYPRASIQMEANGTAVGTIRIESSLNQTTWIDMGLNLTAPAGADEDWLVDLTQTGVPYVRVSYTATGGAGTLDAWVFRKGN